MQLAVRDRDVLVGEEGGLPTLPPTHPDRPLGAVKLLALELVAHRLELRPAALVLLVGEGVGVGDVCWGLSKGTNPSPDLLGAVPPWTMEGLSTPAQARGRSSGSSKSIWSFHDRRLISFVIEASLGPTSDTSMSGRTSASVLQLPSAVSNLQLERPDLLVARMNPIEYPPSRHRQDRRWAPSCPNDMASDSLDRVA